MRFLGLQLEDRVPDAKSVWLFRERLKHAGLIEVLFAGFHEQLATQGYVARAGQMIDATFVEVARQRNSREENAQKKTTASAPCMRIAPIAFTPAGITIEQRPHPQPDLRKRDAELSADGCAKSDEQGQVQSAGSGRTCVWHPGTNGRPYRAHDRLSACPVQDRDDEPRL